MKKESLKPISAILIIFLILALLVIIKNVQLDKGLAGEAYRKPAINEIIGDKAIQQIFFPNEDCINDFDDDNDGAADCFDKDCEKACSKFFKQGNACCVNHKTNECTFSSNYKKDRKCIGKNVEIFPAIDKNTCYRGCGMFRYSYPMEKEIYITPSVVQPAREVVYPESLLCHNELCYNTELSFDYLIITRPIFVEGLDEFITWKTQKGFSVALVTVDWIYSQDFAGENIAKKMKTAMHYFREQNGVVYVLLIGDTVVADPSCADDEVANARAIYTGGAGGGLSQAPETAIVGKAYEESVPVPVKDAPEQFVLGWPDASCVSDVECQTYYQEYGFQYYQKFQCIEGVCLVVPYPNLCWDNFEIDYKLGEPWNVPTLGYSRKGVPNIDLLPSDLPYSDELEWDNVVSVNPIPGLEVDGIKLNQYELNFNAELYVGRWPIRTVQDLNNIVYKTKNMKRIDNFLFIKDISLGGLESICPVWPPTFYKEDSCYNNLFGQVRMLLFNNVNYETYLPNLENPLEAVTAKKMIFDTGQETGLIEEFHGNLEILAFGAGGVLHINDFDEFKHIFPLFDAGSCYIQAFTKLSPEKVFAEALITHEKGPAVFVSTPNKYFFYETLLNGGTVGEAFYSGTDIYVYGPNPFVLFGDPSLVLMKGEYPSVAPSVDVQNMPSPSPYPKNIPSPPS